MSLDTQTIEYYQENAEEVCSRYRSADAGIAARFAQAFRADDRVLDVGCGSGRDMAALQELGVVVTGVDPSAEMIAETARHYPELAERIHVGALPNLGAFEDDSFDGILCSAMLMHLPEELLFDSAWEIKRLLKDNGNLLVSLPLDESIKDQRDAHGRLFNGLLPDKLQLLLERIGFQEIQRWSSDDTLGRAERTWVVQLFRLRGDDGTRSIDRIEAVLNRDTKVATYKLALFRALAELAQTNYNLAAWRLDGKVLIPLEAVAEKWIEYYWPIVEYSEVQIPQTTGRSVAFRAPLEKLIAHYSDGKGGLPRFSTEYRDNCLSRDAMKAHAQLMSKLKSTIWNQPVRYAGGGEHFSVFGYDKVGKNIVLDADMWRELSLTGGWIKDATILRWAELTARISNESIPASQVIDLLLTDALPERDVRAAKDTYDGLSNKQCVWSDKRIATRYDVDHAIPFSLWHNNDLWNLLPASSIVNNQKKDKLPTRELVLVRKDAIIHYWDILRMAHQTRFEYEMRQFCGTGTDASGNWQTRLFHCFSEAVEITAQQRGVARWQPSRMPTVDIPAATDAVIPSAPTNPVTEVTDERPLVPYSEVGGKAFKSFLPFAGEVAAGIPSYDLEQAYRFADDPSPTVAEAMADAGLDWVECPARLVRPRRFVVRVTGDSMEPGCSIGDLVVCEYHRHRQPNHDVVIMANFTDLPDTGDCAIKRIAETPDAWLFESDNQAYDEIVMPKDDANPDYPIYGTVIYNLTKDQAIR